MFILVNIIVVSALLLMLSCLAFVVLLMTCILTKFLVVFNREEGGVGNISTNGSFINLILYCFEGRRRT